MVLFSPNQADGERRFSDASLHFDAPDRVVRCASSRACANGEVAPKTVRIVVAFAPGGGTDIVARSLAARVTTRFGQQFVVDNRPGGGGITGIELVVRAQPDGYTLLVGASSCSSKAAQNLIRPYQRIPTYFSVEPHAIVLVTHPSVSANNVKELIALARAKPSSMSYGSSGNGGIQHLATEMFKSMSNVDIVHVPYKGTAKRCPRCSEARYSSIRAVQIVVAPHIAAGKLQGARGHQRAALAGASRRCRERNGLPATKG